MKENIKSIVKANLTELGIVKPKMHVVGPELEGFDVHGSGDLGLTFEQKKELLLLQTEREKLAVEKLRREAEIKRLEMEDHR